VEDYALLFCYTRLPPVKRLLWTKDFYFLFYSGRADINDVGKNFFLDRCIDIDVFIHFSDVCDCTKYVGMGFSIWAYKTVLPSTSVVYIVFSDGEEIVYVIILIWART